MGEGDEDKLAFRLGRRRAASDGRRRHRRRCWWPLCTTWGACFGVPAAARCRSNRRCCSTRIHLWALSSAPVGRLQPDSAMNLVPMMAREGVNGRLRRFESPRECRPYLTPPMRALCASLLMSAASIDQSGPFVIATAAHLLALRPRRQHVQTARLYPRSPIRIEPLACRRAHNNTNSFSPLLSDRPLASESSVTTRPLPKISRV